MESRVEEAGSLDEYLDDSSKQCPSPLPTQDLAEMIAHIHARTGEGSTVSPYFGDMFGQAFFAVSVAPELTLRMPGPIIDRDLLRRYLEEHQTYLDDPRSALGTWYNSEEDVTYIDIALLIRSKRTALRLGRLYDQIGVFSLHAETPDEERFKEIGGRGAGSGEETWPPYPERLPKLIRRRASSV